jgi:hypothetical protein
MDNELEIGWMIGRELMGLKEISYFRQIFAISSSETDCEITNGKLVAAAHGYTVKRRK